MHCVEIWYQSEHMQERAALVEEERGEEAQEEEEG